jgi:conjugative transfer pilus assembly protein TraH
MKRNGTFFKMTALVTALSLTVAAHAVSLEDIFNGVNAYSNTTGPGAVQGQTMNLYTGGSLFMRQPRKSYQLGAATAPSWSAGCGGIDLFAGAFSYINKEQFVAMLRNIGQQATGYAFKLAIQNLCPTCDNVIQALEATARSVNGMNINSCEMAEGVVNAAMPDAWKKSEANIAKTLGSSTNQFSDALDSWKNVFGDEKKARETTKNALTSNPEMKDKVPEGNVTWKAVKKLPGLDDDTRQIYMSMIGTVIFDGNNGSPQYLPGTDIDVQTLIGSGGNTRVDMQVYQCDETDNCLKPSIGTSKQYRSLSSLVEDKLNALAQHIADNAPWDGDLKDVIAFVNVTDIPVYKMVSVATSVNNRDMAEGAISKYRELIAARYAEVFIQSVAKELRVALSRLSTTADATQTGAIKDMLRHVDDLEHKARQTVAAAHSQTVSTFAIVQEMQSLERALNNSLGPALQQSLAFQKSLSEK